MRIIKFIGATKRRFIAIGIFVILLLTSVGMVSAVPWDCLAANYEPPYKCETVFIDDAAHCLDTNGIVNECRVGCSTCAVVRLACYIFNMLYGIAGFVGALLIVIAGVKWATSGESTTARQQAKDSVVHTVVGLIIVTLAVTVVLMIYTSGQGVTNTNCIGGL